MSTVPAHAHLSPARFCVIFLMRLIVASVMLTMIHTSRGGGGGDCDMWLMVGRLEVESGCVQYVNVRKEGRVEA